MEEELEPTVTTTHVHETVARASTPRSTITTAPYESLPPTEAEPVAETGDFWWALAACESENGRTSDNQFQFMGGTAEKVGYYSGASYTEQRAMAQGWAAALRAEGTHPGSNAGWPECWWIAGGT